MPKLIPFEEMSEKKFIFETIAKASDNDFRLQGPLRLGRKIKDKRVKVTIEILED